LAGCTALVPATAPPQLHREAGDYVVIASRWLSAGGFQLHYPAHWRVVKLSPAIAAEVEVVLVSPAGGTIRLRMSEPAADSEQLLRRLPDGSALSYSLQAPDDAATFLAEARQILRSIHASK